MEWENLSEGWEIANLGNKEFFKRYGGGTPKRDKREYWTGGTIPWVTNNELEENKINYIFSTKEKITEKGLENSSATLIPERAVLLSCTASIGKVGINEIKLATNQQFNSFECNKNRVLPEFLAYFLLIIKQQLEKIAGTTTFKHIIIPNLEKIDVPLPPLEEQKKIVEMLQFADYPRERRKEAIKLVDKIVMSVFYDMFGDPATNPKGWEVKKLEEVIDLHYGRGLSKKKRKKGEYAVYGSNGIIDRHCEYFIEKQTIIIGRKGAVGAVNLTEPKCWAIDTTFYTNIRDNNALDLLYLFFYLKKIDFEKLSITTSIPGINRDVILSLQIPLPPLALQQEFAEIVSKLEEKRKQMEEAEEKLEMLYQILLKQAFTGKLTEEWRMRGKASKSS